MTILTIRDEGTSCLWRVWPDPEVIPAGSVHETGSYLFELREADEAANADLLIDDALLEALRPAEPGTSRWRWLPGFHAGVVEAELRLPGSGVRRFEIATDPDLRKLTRDDFNEMVREILEDTFALFTPSSFRRSVSRGVGGRPPAIARLEFLRSRITELEEVANLISRRPRRMLAAKDASVPYFRAVRATGPEILRSFRSGRILSEADPTRRLPAVLNGFLPEQIRLRRRRSSLDIPEHRQMGACLRAWSAWLTAAGELLERAATSGDQRTGQARRTWAARCHRLAHRLNHLVKLQPFAEAGEAAPRLMISSVFRNDPPYRRFFQLWKDMNLGIAAVFGDFLGMPLARTFELYELWCFLRLVRAAREEYGQEGVNAGNLFINDVAGGVTLVAGAVTIPAGSGWKLCFQKQFREFWLEPNQHGSISRTMRPDIMMQHVSEGNLQNLLFLTLSTGSRMA